MGKKETSLAPYQTPDRKTRQMSDFQRVSRQLRDRELEIHTYREFITRWGKTMQDMHQLQEEFITEAAEMLGVGGDDGEAADPEG